MNETTFYSIQEPGTTIANHTIIRLSPEEAIKEFLEQEQAMNIIANAGRWQRGEPRVPTPSWEHFEAEGYRVVKCRIQVIPEP